LLFYLNVELRVVIFLPYFSGRGGKSYGSLGAGGILDFSGMYGIGIT